MTLLFMDGFDAGDVQIKWINASNTYTSSTSTRFGVGRSIVSATLADSIVKNVTASSQVTVGYAMFIAAGTGTTASLVLRGDAGATTHITVMRSSGGLMEVRRGTTSGTVLATGSTPILLDTWYYIEVQATIADAGGTIKVRLNGASTNEIDFSGDTKNAGTNTTIDQVGFATAAATTMRLDDVYILNSTGTSNTTFLGDVRVHTLAPSNNGTYSQLTGSDGNQADNYQLVDELPYSTADYVGSATTGLRDTYALADLPAGVSQVFGVQSNLIAAKSDGTTGNARPTLLTGGSLYYGATRALTTSYVSYNDVFQTNPGTSSAWSVSEVNSLEGGMEIG